MTSGFNWDALLDELAERVAEKLRPEITAAKANGKGPPPRLLTIEQAALYIGRSKEAMQHMIADGKIPTVRADRRIFIDRQDLDRWIEQHKQAGLV
jgi:excisionase family DNA binding protein